MDGRQTDLFGAAAPAREGPGDEIVAMVRARLTATLALVRAAGAMPWADLLEIIREDNGFRFAKDLLPPDEGAALWAAFNVEMDRLYAIMNAGKAFEDDPAEA